MKKNKKKLTLTKESLYQIWGGEPITDGSCGYTTCVNTDYCPPSRSCPP